MKKFVPYAAAVLLAAAAALSAFPAAAGERDLPSAPRYGLPGMALAAPPPIPGCEAVLPPDAAQRLQLLTVDPEEAFESWRRANPRMTEAPPWVHCAHLAFVQAHPKKSALDTLLEESAVAVPVAAAAGSNVDLSGGETGYQGEVQIAIDPSNPDRIVAGANTFYADGACQAVSNGGTQAFFGSTDGGATWRYRCAPWPASVTGGCAAPAGGGSARFGSDPAMAWDAAGNAYGVYMLVSEAWNSSYSVTCDTGAIVVARSSDAGATWSSLGTVVNNFNNGSVFDDKEMVAVDRSSGKAYSHPGRVYVIWDENNVERVAWSDGGASFTTTLVSGSGLDIGGNLAVGPDGAVYAVWNHYSTSGGVGAGDRTYFCRSTNGGVSWSSPVQIGPTHNLASFGNNNTPPAQGDRGINAFAAIDVDANPASAYHGRLYVVYNDFPANVGSGADVDVFSIWSGNGGSTWSAPVRVNDDGTGATQFFPWASVDQSDGSLNVSWYDTRNYSAYDRQAQVYYARSVNGGVSFERNVLVTDGGGAFANGVSYTDESASDNPGRNSNQYGDYGGMAAGNRRAHALWTDTRNFFPGNTTDARHEDLATSTIVNCSAPAPVSPPVLSCASGGGIALSWSASASWGTNATGGTYEVDRYTDAACTQGKAVLATGLTGTSYTDATAAAGTSYTYEIVAKNDCPGTALTAMSSASACSSTRACGTACSTPPSFAGLSSATAGSCTVALAWSAGTSACGGTLAYDVYRGTSSGFPPSSSNRIATYVSGTSFTDTGVANGTTYYYVVRAVDSANGVEETNTVQRSAVASCAPAAARRLYTLAPCRLVDTRSASGPLGGPALAAGATRTFALAGACGVPADAAAVSVNVTAVNPAAAGDFRAWAAGSTMPLATVLNFPAGRVRANGAFVNVSRDGASGVSVKNESAGAVDLLLDVNGFWR